MASLVPRKDKDGNVSSYQVKWRQDGDWQNERFTDETAADIFKKAVEDSGNTWPPGWVKGRGYIDPGAEDESQYRFDVFARRSIANRTAGDYYKKQRIRTWRCISSPASRTATFGPPSTSARRRSAPGSTRCAARRCGAGAASPGT